MTDIKMMKFQRVRNLTTGRLHTKMVHVYRDIEYITKQKGIMTHQLPRALRALEPWLRQHISDERFWDGAYDKKHKGEMHIPQMTPEEQKEFFDRMFNPPRSLAESISLGLDQQIAKAAREMKDES